MRKRSFWVFFGSLLLLLPALRVFGENGNPGITLQQANAAYRGGDYAKSISLYESLISNGWKNATVFYNLGNAYFKQDRLGPAILAYEKAKRLDPRDRDVLSNLDYVRGLLEYRIEDKRGWYARAAESILSSFTQIEIAIASLFLSFVFLLSWGFSLYFGSGNSWGWKRKTLLVLALIGLSLWGLKGLRTATLEEAIVLKHQASVRYGPSYKDQVAFRLAEGMKVGIKKIEGDWKRVALINGETGWMYEEHLGVI